MQEEVDIFSYLFVILLTCLCILGKFYIQEMFQKVMILGHLGAFVFHQCWYVSYVGK